MWKNALNSSKTQSNSSGVVRQKNSCHHTFGYGPTRENIDRQIYHGNFNSHHQSHGKGQSSYVNNDKSTIEHSGEWINGHIHGKGRTVFSVTNNDTGKKHTISFSGSWLEGKRHGEGKLILSNGSYYEGGFKFGKFHGKGKFVCPSLFEYTGNFFKGFVAGRGKVQFFGGLFTGKVVHKVWHEENLGLTIRDAIEYIESELFQEHKSLLDSKKLRKIRMPVNDEFLNKRANEIKAQIKEKRVLLRKLKDEEIRQWKIGVRRKRTQLIKSQN